MTRLDECFEFLFGLPTKKNWNRIFKVKKKKFRYFVQELNPSASFFIRTCGNCFPQHMFINFISIELQGKKEAKTKAKTKEEERMKTIQLSLR